MASAALVIAGMALARPSAPPAATGTPADTTAADKALCTAIAPILAESDRTSNAYTKLGEAGNPARDAATPQFITDTTEWVRRGQEVLDSNTDASGFLRRTLQRFLDDNHLLVVGLQPGQLPKYEDAIYDDMMAAYNGPISTCSKLGVKW